MSGRKEKYDSAAISQQVSRLRRQAAKLAALAKEMQKQEIQQVEVDGSLMMLRGLDQIDNFSNNVDRAIREQIRQIR